MQKDPYFLLQPAVKVLINSLFNPTIEFESEIPLDEKIILVGNHISNFDSLLLASVVYRKIHFLAKSELFKGPMKYLMESIGSIPVNRDGNDFLAIRNSIQVLNNDNCLLIFPEGTRSNAYKTKQLILPFKAGTIMIAKRSLSDIIPFAITGNYSLVKNNLHISFGSRIKTSDYNSRELLEKVETDVKSLILKNKNR